MELYLRCSLSFLQAMWLCKHLNSNLITKENLLNKEFSQMAEEAKKHYEIYKVSLAPEPGPGPEQLWLQNSPFLFTWLISIFFFIKICFR